MWSSINDSRELGYIDGQNLAMEFLNPDTQPEGIAGSIKELIGRKVDVIIAPYENAVKSALVATDTVPIVMKQLWRRHRLIIVAFLLCQPRQCFIATESAWRASLSGTELHRSSSCANGSKRVACYPTAQAFPPCSGVLLNMLTG